MANLSWGIETRGKYLREQGNINHSRHKKAENTLILNGKKISRASYAMTN